MLWMPRARAGGYPGGGMGVTASFVDLHIEGTTEENTPA